ncbi:hypothetical protein PVAP13_6NG240606 [Panicum virgatum]|uniref:Uncharacterized protein n=1 Tax=Panicum virgatum TaxID=38727 RepID=A0A8T0R1Y7_PANVG|nr:hypothetical protein PVAP13_6NG240606 [Panicum virgatum]
MDLHLQSCACACRRASARRSRPSPAPRWGLAELPTTRWRTGSARTGGPSLDARWLEAFLGPLLPRQCPPVWTRGRRRRRPTRAGGPRPGCAVAGGVARPAPPALLGAGPDAQQSTATARAGGPRPRRAAAGGVPRPAPPAPVPAGLDARQAAAAPHPRRWPPARSSHRALEVLP